jgi:tRNA U38,U39,U40 pseudouridine synthase TruA
MYEQSFGQLFITFNGESFSDNSVRTIVHSIFHLER